VWVLLRQPMAPCVVPTCRGEHPREMSPPTVLVRRVRGFLPSVPSAVTTRECRGCTIAVTVLDTGFEYEGKIYRSPTAV
jgi:hypothetical protein